MTSMDSCEWHVRMNDGYEVLTVWTASDSYFEVEVCVINRRVVGTVG